MSLDTESSSTDTASLGSSMDEIAELISGDEAEESTDESTSEATPTDESTDSEESSEDDTEGTDESEDEASTSNEDEDDSDWAAVLGLDENQLDFDEEGNFSGVNVKVNGESSKVNMKDLVLGYQNNKSFTKKSQALAEERTAFEQGRTTAIQEYNAKLENVEALSNMLGNKLTQEFDGINWEALRVENPAEYAALRQDYASRANDIQKSQQAIAAEKQSQQQQFNQQNSQQRAMHLQGEFDKMIAKNPTWTDEKTLKSDMSDMKEFMTDQYGFKIEDFNNVSDSRLIEVMKDAKAYRKGVTTAKAKMKKKVPKFQKSKTSNGKKKRASKLDNLMNRASKASGASARDAQTDAIAGLLGGL